MSNLKTCGIRKNRLQEKKVHILAGKKKSIEETEEGKRVTSCVDIKV